MVASGLGRPQVARSGVGGHGWSRIVRCSSRRRPPRPPASSIPRRRLYVVATPIGNLADLSFRALHVLATRRRDRLRGHPAQRPAARALRPEPSRCSPSTSTTSATRPARSSPGSAAGERVAYISDAGTPAVSDPGAALVAAVRDAGFRVRADSGREQRAGRPARSPAIPERDGFEVVGFLPARGAERTRALARCAAAAPTQVLFEAPHRIEALAAALGKACPQRVVTVCRELTKQFETVATLPAQRPAGLARGRPEPGARRIRGGSACDRRRGRGRGRRRSRCSAQAAAGRAAAEAGGGSGRGDRAARRATCSTRARSF